MGPELGRYQSCVVEDYMVVYYGVELNSLCKVLVVPACKFDGQAVEAPKGVCQWRFVDHDPQTGDLLYVLTCSERDSKAVYAAVLEIARDAVARLPNDSCPMAYVELVAPGVPKEPVPEEAGVDV